MILKIEFENFFSIRDRVRIDFRAANINTTLTRELRHNVIDWNGVPVLKSVGLFGPNASGKSNILKAVSFCCRSESLYHFPFGRRAKIFVRNADGKYSFGTGVISKPADVVLNTSDKNLFLSRASSMNREIAQMLYRYFMNQFLLGLVNVNDVMVLDGFNTYKRVILKALEVCDTDITDIEVRKEQIPAPVVAPGQGEISFKLMDVLKFKTFHRGNKDVMFDLDLEESNGTKKLFQILIRLLDVVKSRKGIMMDEFDMGLHTRLADFILDLIHASGGSQLLFSSHNTHLIDVKRLRRDQIVFVNKTEDGATEVYSLYDFKDFRENMDAEKGYIQGRFDAVPYVDSSVDSIKQLLEG